MADSISLYATVSNRIKPIPFTNLTINREGEIFKGGNKLLLSNRSSGTPTIDLPIRDGNEIILLKGLSLATLISIVFKNSRLHWKYWPDIELFYKDGDRGNISPDNLAHQMYPEHFAYEFEGEKYKIIPMFTRYGISSKGVIFNSTPFHKTKPLSLGSKNVFGYHRYTLIDDIEGCTRGIGRHRIFGLCFKIGKSLDDVYTADVDNLEVNHINHTPGSDALTNLEWVTTSENQLHSIYHGGVRDNGNMNIVALDIQTGELHYFKTVAECFKTLLGINRTSIPPAIFNSDSPLYHRLYYGSIRVNKNTTHEPITGNHPILTTIPTLTEYCRFGITEVIDVRTDKVIFTGSMKEMNRALELGYSNSNDVNGIYIKTKKIPRLKHHSIRIQLGVFPVIEHSLN